MSPKSLDNLGWISNQPDISIKTLTQTIERDSHRKRIKAENGSISIKIEEGGSRDLKLAWTTRTKSIETILKSSMLEFLFLCVNNGLPIS